MNTNDIVQKLWNLCHVLRDDGVTYHQYVTELTFLLFLKMAAETGVEGQIPEGYRWADLAKGVEGKDRLDFYRSLLVHLGSHGSKRVKAIFANASTFLKRPKNLETLIDSIDKIDWYSVEREQLGDLYEGLLQKNAGEKKSGAGQYFTPRPLIDAMVRVSRPQAGEVVQDPAAGTAGFLIAADKYVKAATNDLFDLPAAKQEFQRARAYVGVELVEDAHRLCLMNLMLHDIDCDVVLGDTLGPDGAALSQADLVLTNPPFGTKKGGGGSTRDDLTHVTNNKQLAFVQHIYRALKPGGRAAVVVPDNVLFEEGVGVDVRRDLMEKCDLHTVLRLPTGIFYAQAVKTNVLFFTRGRTDRGSTRDTWVYDLRANAPAFGKRTPLTEDYFAPFVAAYGERADGRATRKEEGDEGRFRRFTRQQIAERNDNLDISWLRDDSETATADLPEPEDVADRLMDRFETATREIAALRALLDGSTNGSAR